jgi:hypothetical protein
LLSISVLEDSGFFLTFPRGKVLIHIEESIPDTEVTIGVRYDKLYRLQGNRVGGSKEILDHGSMLVKEDEDKKGMKFQQSS